MTTPAHVYKGYWFRLTHDPAYHHGDVVSYAWSYVYGYAPGDGHAVCGASGPIDTARIDRAVPDVAVHPICPDCARMNPPQPTLIYEPETGRFVPDEELPEIVPA